MSDGTATRAARRRALFWPMVVGVALHPVAYAPWVLLADWALRTIYAGPAALAVVLGLLPILGWLFAVRGVFALLALLGILGLFAWPALSFAGAGLLHLAWRAPLSWMQAGHAVVGLQWVLYPAWVWAMWRAGMGGDAPKRGRA